MTDIISLIPTIMFYVFALLLTLSAMRVISSKNPVHSVLFLILAFFNAAGLFILLGAEFIGMLLIIVYVGAVAVLFLFVVMMLNVNFSELQKNFVKYLPMGLVISGIIFAELVIVIKAGLIGTLKNTPIQSPVVNELTNTENIGMLLYTDYVYAFQIAGLILLVAMVGAIVLTLRVRTGVLKQKISQQLARDPKKAISIVKVDLRKGIDL